MVVVVHCSSCSRMCSLLFLYCPTCSPPRGDIGRLKIDAHIAMGTEGGGLAMTLHSEYLVELDGGVQ